VSGDPFSLAGKTILITGASSGIGREVAVSCAKRGATAVISGRNRERLDETLKALDAGGHRAYAADLTELEQIHALADASGSIDGLFFSAGIALIAPFRMINQEHVRKLMRIDFEAPILLTQRLLKQRQIRDGGSIVFNTALAARTAPQGTAIYAAAKAGLTAAARSLALEVARTRIRVTCLQLGYVRTALLDGLANSGMNVTELANLAPLGLGEPLDVANAAIFLLSDASRWVSRTELTADGGLILRMP
jgi:NAD(P)-dependent dehydrogenase (short-subunit alcohol dehydrogenase family)